MEQSLVRIIQQPFLHPIIFENFRAVRTRGFPYRIIYGVHEESIEVMAVFHDRRDPSEWQTRH